MVLNLGRLEDGLGQVMHFSDRTVVVCMLLGCASRLQGGGYVHVVLRLEIIVKRFYLVYFDSVDSATYLYFPILQEAETECPV